jgi:hypothetical protein
MGLGDCPKSPPGLPLVPGPLSIVVGAAAKFRESVKMFVKKPGHSTDLLFFCSRTTRWQEAGCCYRLLVTRMETGRAWGWE